MKYAFRFIFIGFDIKGQSVLFFKVKMKMLTHKTAIEFNTIAQMRGDKKLRNHCGTHMIA